MKTRRQLKVYNDEEDYFCQKVEIQNHKQLSSLSDKDSQYSVTDSDTEHSYNTRSKSSIKQRKKYNNTEIFENFLPEKQKAQSIAMDIEEDYEISKKQKVKKKLKNITQMKQQNQQNEISNQFGKNHYQKAFENLQEYSLPDQIPCREQEKQLILEFLQEGIKNQGTSQSLYISGVPGIGKTACFMEVIKDMQQQNEDFAFVPINGMELSNPEHAYNQILTDLTAISHVSQLTACNILSDMFRKGKLPKKYNQPKYKQNLNKIKIILLDELDYLLTPSQSLLYNLFDWPNEQYSRLIVVGIANTMDFPERLLHKIASRIGNKRVVFKPYTSLQIQQIIESRLLGLDIFENVALQFASKKIATFSSDIRRTLYVCRKAVEIAEQRYIEKIKEKNQYEIIKSYQQIYSSVSSQCFKFFGLEMKMRGQNFGYFSDIYIRGKSMANSLGQLIDQDFITKEEAFQIFVQIQSMNIIAIKEKLWLSQNNVVNQHQMELNPNKQIIFNISDYQIEFRLNLDDLTNGLKDDSLLSHFQNLF